MTDPKWLIAHKPFVSRTPVAVAPFAHHRRDLRSMSFKEMHKEAIRDFGKTVRAEKFANAMRRIQLCQIARDEHRAASCIKTL